MLRHYRIFKDGRFVGGEFCEYEDAVAWAKQHVSGFFAVIETDRYGNELNVA